MSTGIIRDRTAVITHDLIVGHKYEVRVVAVGSDGVRQAIEDAAHNTIVIEGAKPPPTTPDTLTTSGYLNAINLVWENSPDYDFDYMEVWRATTNDIDLAVKIAKEKGITYLDTIGLGETTRYYWIRAVNTSGEVSDFYPSTTAGVSGISLGVAATSIADFAVTASKIYTKIPILDGDTWTDNTPGAGSIAWNSHSLYYNGNKYTILAGNSNKKYIYWQLVSSVNTYQKSDTAPTRDDTTFIICMNNSGSHNVAWNSIANQVIGSAYILDAAIVEAKISNLAVTNAKIGLLAVDTAQIAALAVEEAQIANLAVTDAKINDLTVNKLTSGTMFSTTITLASSGTDCYINAGKTDYDNTQSGFILGIDHSDAGKPKFYIGDATTYMNWTGSGLAVKGTFTVVSASGIDQFTDAGNLVTVDEDAVNALNLNNGPAEANADVTSTHEAATIASQGNLATKDVVSTSECDTTIIDGGKIVTGLLTATNIQTGTLSGIAVYSKAAGDRVYLREDGGVGVLQGWATALKNFEIRSDNGDADFVGDVNAGGFEVGANIGQTGSFEDNNSNTVTVTGGIITDFGT